MLKTIEIFIIKFYQKHISKLASGNCRMQPTCSNYALIAITRFGILKGNFLLLKRLFKCSSKKHTTIDYVPQNIKGDYKWLI